MHRILQSSFQLRITFRSPYQPSAAFAKYAVEVLNVSRFDVVWLRAAKDYSSFLTDECTVFPNLYQLGIMQFISPEIIWENIGIVIVTVREKLDVLVVYWRFDPSRNVENHLSASFLSPLADSKSHKEI